MKNTIASKSFHSYSDIKPGFFRDNRIIKYFAPQECTVSYRFYPHFHPYVGKLTQRLIQKSISALQAADTEYEKKSDGSFETLGDGKTRKPIPEFYADGILSNYGPNLVEKPYPVMDLDFTTSGAYSVYNWELFFHVPLTIAMHLSKNHRHQEAQQWFHYLFDPTDDSDDSSSKRFWKVRPFQYTTVEKIEDLLVNLATGQDLTLRDEMVSSIEAWKKAPFRPHLIARYRQQAYMFKTVMAYLDNLISWGDSLFQQDTGESIDEALMLYVLAANILGPRPQLVPKKSSVRPQTYSNLQKSHLDEFRNAMCEFEAEILFDLTPFPSEAVVDGTRIDMVRNLGKALYFCVPRNDKLLGYWDTVADRLFKIRNSLNIQGIFRQLPLFEPPIDPALLARAVAAGLDVGAVISGLNQPLPLVRFQFLVQKALEICQEVKAMGNNLLSAMEKEDGEALAILRAKHERAIMKMVEHIKYAQWQETIKSYEGLLKSLALAVQRYIYYERQLGKKSNEIVIPEWEELDENSKNSIEKMNFSIKEPEVFSREITIDIATDAFAQVARALNGGRILSSHEVRELLFLERAQLFSDTANILNVAGSLAHTVPTFQINVQPWGVGETTEYGGKNVGDSIGGCAAAARAVADRLNFEARRAERIGSYARREQEWAFQSNLAAGEITQIFKQLRASQIRSLVAEQELKVHQKQMEHAEEIERFLNEEGADKDGKKTNKSLYVWMKREVKGLYGQCFQLAFDIAKKAERALQHELGNTELRYLQPGHLAGKEGLLAGEKLYLDIKRMDITYHELNQREYELTKHVSLLQVNPLALMQLRTTGRCTIEVPETLFDMDGPGHYFRRIKSVAVSIPCVIGPYASINCTLTLLKSSIRKKTPVLHSDEYARENAEDDRFDDYSGSLQSIVASSAQNDSGMFETNLHDERYLPFEGAGAVSTWQLKLPANPSEDDFCQFNYDTISNVILHMRYTAREGGDLLHNKAKSYVKGLIEEAQAAGSVQLFSVRHDFPTEWEKFKNHVPETNQRLELAFNLRKEHFPYWCQKHLGNVDSIEVLVRNEKSLDTLEVFAGNPSEILTTTEPPETPTTTEKKDKLNKIKEAFGDLLYGDLKETITLPKKLEDEFELKIFFDNNKVNKAIKDLWIAVTWSKEKKP